MSRAGADLLSARIGDAVSIGQSRLTLAALVVQEPDAAMDYFNVAPKVFLNLADLPATELVQEGSRVRYRLVVARSEERRVGKECGSTCRSRWSQYHQKKKHKSEKAQ